tara:strand:+ start:9894 stop:10433 length:540 start_codon:yes stop_codon:yes gene_type:complete
MEDDIPANTDPTPPLDLDWEQLYDKHAKALVLYARQWLPSMSDAEDTVQDAFIRLIKSPKQFDENPVPILYQAVKWAALDRIRSSERRQKREETSTMDHEPISYFEDRLETQERKEAIERSLQQLPEDQREVLKLRVWGELGFREIGEALGISINTAASRYRYALKKLGELLDAQELTA